MPGKARVFVYCCAIFGVFGQLPSFAAAPPNEQQGEQGPSQAAPATILDQSTLQIAEQPSLIDRLNLRYNNVVEHCDDGASALHCSGIILRRSTFNPNFSFWTHSPAAKALGSVTFSWLRADGTSNSNDLSSGFIFMDNSTARAAGYALQTPRCIYPFMAGTQGAAAGRWLHGCGPTKTEIWQHKDESSCMIKATPATDPDGWAADFKGGGLDRSKQCSLSVQVPEQLITSLKVRASHSDIAKAYGNELLIPTWDENYSKQLPIEAFFYNTAKSGAFENSLNLRDAFYKETFRLVPIVGLDLGATDKQVFKPLSRDQQGIATANGLNLRYANTLNDCEFKAPLYCAGVILRTTTFSPNFRAWNPSQKSVDSGAVSFSYLRTDLGITTLAWNTLNQGLIFNELDAVKQPRMYPITPLCMYPTDAASWNRGANGCGIHSQYGAISDKCAPQNITNLEQLQRHFHSVADNGAYFNERNKHQCSLAINLTEFNLASVSRKSMLNAQQQLHHNELIVGTWPQNIPDLLPLEAFFYQYKDDNTAKPAIEQAKGMQQDLLTTANGLWKPVIRLNLAAPSGGAFATYRAQDQN
ncbi:hypothetical protein [Pseudomonas putida]|uniref:hypothetical protein n=1 Tax=Pseudomonas TaxID=286 RepID=UPI0018D640CE|nr:hypothetical protein [Pseudomonas putida]MBH3459876.1 hypothetical protein [Pseudomonas putida]